MITINCKKINTHLKEKPKYFTDIIKAYENYVNTNNFNDLVCPRCKNTGTLVFYKTYERNLTICIKDEIKNYKINIAVCKCTYCAKFGNGQKYHALLPFFVLPYAIYEASTILKAINDYYIGKKLCEIIEKIQIGHKLFYDWLKKFNKYLFSSSIVLSTISDSKIISSKIIDVKATFLENFYHQFFHPFFLFKTTCVKLCITP